ncbi:MAG TPA: site-2 protease family protein [Thermoanaerobaculia bacterium]
MKSSFRLLTVAGIDIKVHFTFPVILILGAFQWAGPYGAPGAAFGVLLMATLFACVVLHELGHSLVAQRLGVPVREIILLPIGGVAILGRMPRRPLHELLVAIAGPLVNVVIAGLLVFVLRVQGGLSLDGRELTHLSEASPSTETFLQWLLAANVGLVLFNLIPAFPMDGGRMLRAILAMFLGFRRATQVASGIGQLLAFGLGLFGIFRGHFLLTLVAFFVFVGAGQERATEEARALLSTFRLGDVYNKHALTLQPGDQVARVLDYLLTSYQPDFAVLHGDRLLGVVTRDAVLKSLASGEAQGYVTGIMNREPAHLDASMSLAEAREALTEKGIHGAAVFDGEHFLGLINVDDIQEALQIAAFLQVAGARRGEGLDAA